MSTPIVAPDTAPTTDVEALIALVAEVERTQRRRDADGFLALFDPTAVWVNGAGRRLIGLPEIDLVTRQVLPGLMGDLHVSYDVEYVGFLTDDLAVTGVRQHYTEADGSIPADGGAGSPTYLWRRTGDTWRIVLGQNTAVVKH